MTGSATIIMRTCARTIRTREQLKEGDVVTAGDVIGYMGHTGYSTKENVNNIDTVHLHYGLRTDL